MNYPRFFHDMNTSAVIKLQDEKTGSMIRLLKDKDYFEYSLKAVEPLLATKLVNGDSMQFKESENNKEWEYFRGKYLTWVNGQLSKI